MADNFKRTSLLSSQARISAPWVKVTIGSFTFGIFDKKGKNDKDDKGFYTAYDIQYPNYIQSLNITKTNGQINQYTLTIQYPIRPGDDPNFFEKVFSSVSSTRKIVFSYGDSCMPSYVYKDEEAIITGVTTTFSLEASRISYIVKAVSSAALSKSGSYTFINSGKKKPSDEIKRILRDPSYGLQDIFTGMNNSNIDKLIDGDDQAVKLSSKEKISALDYLLYLTSCMLPIGGNNSNISKDIYVLTIHDDTTFDTLYSDRELVDGKEITGAYFRVSRTNYLQSRQDAYTIDIGFNTSTLVSGFSIENNENYSLFYDYQTELNPEQYVRRLNNKGEWEEVFAPAVTSKDHYFTKPEDITWWTKLTKYPIKANITIQGLLKPATLMTYIRLNVIFPGGSTGAGNKHISSGLYMITGQQDSISTSGYKTTLSLVRIQGDNSFEV